MLIVDDADAYFSAFLPYLAAVTEGKADGIKVVSETIEELVEKIIAKDPTVAPIDYNFHLHYNGAEVVRQLRDKGCSAKLFGFSNASENAFSGSGADGLIFKDIGPEQLTKILVDKLKQS